MNRKLIEEILAPDNLIWAWEKTKFCLRPGDIWFDELETFKFESNLQNEIDKISNDIRNSTYLFTPIIPIAYPKGVDENGSPQNRQMFEINIKDQFIWIAFLNVVGKYLDSNMPHWSYANRLYMSMYKSDPSEIDNGLDKWQFGWYRNSQKHIYKKWNQSWPLYRKHISATIKLMAQLTPNAIDQAIIQQNQEIPNYYSQFRNQYLLNTYWGSKIRVNDEIYWGSIDLKKFYPNCNCEYIKNIILNSIKDDYTDLSEVEKLLDAMFSFEINYDNWKDEQELELVQLTEKPVKLLGIPTGLFVGGFLSNIMMLKVDKIVNEKLKINKNIAHYRYADDHLILSNSFERLVEWIDDYKIVLESECPKLKVNEDKTEPRNLAIYLKDRNDGLTLAKKECKLDPEFPVPLMTKTLQKMSQIGAIEFDLLSADEQDNFILDLEQLMLADISESEVKKDTRVSFAATVLSKSVINKTTEYNLDDILQLSKEYKLFEKNVAGSNISNVDNSGERVDERVKVPQINCNELITRMNGLLPKPPEVLINSTFDVLKKAVFDNFDKIRLWNRLIYFCNFSGFTEYSQIEKLLVKLKESNSTTNISIDFFKSIILHILSINALIAFNRLKSKDSTYMDRSRAKVFLELLIKEDNNDFTFLLNSNSTKYNYSKSKILFYNISSLIKVIECNKSFDELEIQGNKKEWLLWFFEKVKPVKDEILTREFSSYIEKQIKFDSPLDVKLIYLIDKPIGNFQLLNEGWVVEKIILYKMFNSSKELASKIQNGMMENYSKTCFEYFSQIKNNSNNKFPLYNPANSEWTALEVLKQISNEYLQYIHSKSLYELESNNFNSFNIKQSQKLNFVCIHPYNILIPNSWNINKDSANKLTWEHWKYLLNQEKIKLRELDDSVVDIRYIYSKGINYEISEESNILLSLILLFACILAKNFDLPFDTNTYEGYKSLSKIVHSKLKYTPISTYSRLLIEQVLSRKLLENIYINKYLNKDSFDVYEIRKHIEAEIESGLQPIIRLQTFVEYISKYQKIIESYQSNVTNDMPRQLIPISINQITQSKNFYNE